MVVEGEARCLFFDIVGVVVVGGEGGAVLVF